MAGVDTGEWLLAVDAHPETIDIDLVVAVAIANGETTVDGMNQADVDDCIEELIGHGFLADVLKIDCLEHGDSCEEHVLELRLPPQ